MAYLNLAMAPPLVAVGKLPLRNESNKGWLQQQGCSEVKLYNTCEVLSVVPESTQWMLDIIPWSSEGRNRTLKVPLVSNQLSQLRRIGALIPFTNQVYSSINYLHFFHCIHSFRQSTNIHWNANKCWGDTALRETEKGLLSWNWLVGKRGTINT